VEDLELCVGDSYLLMKNELGGQVVSLYFSNTIEPQEIKSEYKEVRDSLVFPYSCINRLVVTPKYRRKGLANSIMDKFFEIHKDFNSFIVSAQPDDEDYMKKEDLLNFYRKFGFEFLKETDEGTLMVKIKK
jgi:GNAT superfamily N-acetyltransferase